MSNLFDYLAWRGDLSFSAAPFNEVDNLILSMLSFIEYREIVPSGLLGVPVKLSECLRRYDEKFPSGKEFGVIIPEETTDLFRRAASSVRFSGVYAAYYVSETSEALQTQFAAVTFILPDNSIFIAFRGTDDTLIGWREDFNLSFTCPVRSQELAASYVTDVASVYRGDIRLGGHSKGGNLAVYAAAFVPPHVQPRIVTAYSNDGPGFLASVLESEEYRAVADRVVTFVPQSSVIGMLLEHSGDYHVIESTISNGLHQHDPFSWSVLGSQFVHLDRLSKKGQRHDQVLRSWLSKLDGEERRKFTETLFGVLDSTGAKTLSDLTEGRLNSIAVILRTFGNLDRETKDQVYGFIKRLAEAAKE
ncbi:MAG: DUF2974 domain-containing protein [Eubacteriales bacterium]